MEELLLSAIEYT